MARNVTQFICLCGGFIFSSVVWTYENVALRKTAYQLSTRQNFTADLAVDGEKSNLSVWEGECALSDYGYEKAVWHVDLGEVLSIHHIFIQYATNNRPWDKTSYVFQSFLGFSVYISNTTNKTDGKLCFKHLNYNESFGPDVNITCSYHGRYIIYFNNRTHPPFPSGYSSSAFSELCEVEVYECDKNTYGFECSETCGNCTNGEQCNHVNGNCPNGCDVGVFQDKCDRECHFGWYGTNCSNACNDTCNGCNRFTGRCEPGCHNGWEGMFCEKKCSGRKYGKGCGLDCGRCLHLEQCHHIDGTCLNGCDKGYKGPYCTEVCDAGYYGHECNKTCKLHCPDGICDITTGVCLREDQSKDAKSRGNMIFIIVGVPVACVVIAIIVLAAFVVISKRKCTTQKCVPKHKKDGGEERESNTFISVTETPENPGKHTYANVNVMEWTPSSEPKERIIEEKTEISELGKQQDNECSSKKCHGRDDDNDVGGMLHLKYHLDLKYDATSDILIDDLQDVIFEMKREDNKGFKTEFNLLPSGKEYMCNDSKGQANISKNRYKTILPYDHSRVVLKGGNESPDYINANYIYGYNRESVYIASQGPKDNTVKEFWRMVWQENVTQIVMLTNLKEGGKNKCFQYWPDCLKTQFQEHIAVESVSETHCAFYIIRKLLLSHKQERKPRVVLHYHFTMWPDHATPDPLRLVIFHSYVLKTMENSETPVVVHCSAGVGRTGTYIALDALYKEGKATGKVNVAAYVGVMRSCRMKMVQTYEQYMTIFIALYERFKASVEIQSLSAFVEKLNCPNRQLLIGEQFEKLLQIRPKYSHNDYKEASQYLLNTKDTVLPLDRYVLYLGSQVDKRTRIINAIQVSSYLRNNAFIVTQYPTPEDAVDFLRLLIDHESPIVICMEPLSEMESSKTFLPESASLKTVTPFSVEHVCERDTDVRVTNVRILSEEDLSHPVVIVEPREILNPQGESQNTFASSLLSLVSHALSITTEGPITIVSRDGASLCGVFCAVLNSVQQINMDNSVDVFTTVRQLQTRRPEFCSTLDEYWLVYRALRDYIETTSEHVYCNM